MAAKPTKPKKFRQARKDARPAAKKTFSGNPQARLKDPKLKLSADDKMALKEMRDSAKADLGNKSTLTKKEFSAADNAARERFRSEMRGEFGEYGGKKATELDSPRNTRVMKESAPRPKTKAINPLNKTRTFVEASPVKSQTEKPKTKKAAAPKKVAAKKPAAKTIDAKETFSTKKKPAVKKPVTTSVASDKTLKTPEGKARYDKLIKDGVKPKSALNKALFYEGKLPGQKAAAVKKTAATKTPTTKNGAFKKVTDASLTSQEDAYRQSKVDKLVKEGKLSSSKEIAIRPKNEVVKPGSKVPATRTQVATRIPGSDTVVKGSKLGKFGKFVGRGGALMALVDAPNLIKGSKENSKAAIRLEMAKQGGSNKYYANKDNFGTKDLLKSLGKDALVPSVNQLAKYFTAGAIGESVGDRAKRLNKEAAALEKKNTAKATKSLRYGPNGESLVPGTDAWKKGSKTRPSATKPGAGGTTPGTKPGAGTTPGTTPGGGSGTTPGTNPGAGSGGGSKGAITSGAYIVKSGDTLSAIAKRAGVKLEDIYATNKKFKTNPKYKGGNMIWSGTKVNIPTKK